MSEPRTGSTIRLATEADAPLIAGQRRAMFEDAVAPVPGSLPDMQQQFEPWVRARLRTGEYRGWIAEAAGSVGAGGAVAGGAGLWVMEFPPHFLHLDGRRGYLLNFYVTPEHRGRGLAKRLLAEAVAEGRRLGLRVLVLHASRFGKHLYEQAGFRPNNEMILLSDGSTEPTM